MQLVYKKELPSRVRVLVLGGGIHGVGVLHDLASRGWSDVHLLEKDYLGRGTSSRSTKLIHGGLRYLRRIRDFGLVAEALKERKLLMDLVPDLVHPIELVFPVLKKGGMPWWMIKTGLSLYDGLAGRHGLEGHSRLSTDRALELAPILDPQAFKKFYSFYDAQTDDLGLVRRVAASAVQLGAGVTEGVRAERLRPTDDGWEVEVVTPDGSVRVVSARYVINAIGPWADQILNASGITPTHRGINNKGSHLIFPDMGLKAGLFLQSPNDGRIFFVLPWLGKTLVGTTEELFDGNPDQAAVEGDEVEYLISRCNQYLAQPLKSAEVEGKFAGLRWLAAESGSNLTETSRSYVLGERNSKRGLLMTIYGGKLTTYRNLSATIGDRILSHFGEPAASRTHLSESWVAASDTPRAEIPIVSRFAEES